MNLLAGILNIFKGGGSSALGIDIGSSAIKVVQLRKQKGHAVLETYGELSVGPYGKSEIGRAVKLPIEKMTEALVDVLREAKTNGRECGVAIPISSSLVTTIELPLVDEKQFAQMIPLEARKYIPVPITEVALDWWILPKEIGGASSPFQEGQTGSGNGVRSDEVQAGRLVDVLLAVVHNDAVRNYQDIVKSAGLNSSFYEVEIFSTIRSSLVQEKSPVLIFDMGAATTKLYVADRGVVKDSHMVNRGSQDITLALARGLNLTDKEAELLKRNNGLEITGERREVHDLSSTTLSYILSEASRVVLSYEKHTGQRLGKIVLAGGGSLLKGFKEFAQSFFETEVQLADPFGRVEAPAFLRPILQKAGPEFAVAIGLALRRLQEMP